LFRFSPLTYNAHRIHYDLPYAKGEGHPARRVHAARCRRSNHRDGHRTRVKAAR
jgi:hypothetical protein